MAWPAISVGPYVAVQSNKFYKRYPGDVKAVKDIARYLLEAGAHTRPRFGVS